MQPTISIPQHWPYPRFNLEQRTPEELFSEITAEIEFYQQQISILQQQLAVLTGGFINA